MTSNETRAPEAFVPMTPSELNQHLGAGIEIQTLIGQGGMGAVYKGLQMELNREVAVKVLPPVENRPEWDFRERFRQEARAMAMLDHPNIVKAYDFGEMKDGSMYIVMEYVNGWDLHSLIQSGGLKTDHVTSWIPQLCEGLTHAHNQDLIHRDVKPGNILVSSEGLVKITDFGLVKMKQGPGKTGLTQASLSIGTPDYLAPEARESGGNVDHRADVYSLGVVLYEMLTGSIPRGAWRMPSMHVLGLDARFDRIVVRAMQPEPEDRYATASDLERAVLEVETVKRPKLHVPDTAKPRRLSIQSAPTEIIKRS